MPDRDSLFLPIAQKHRLRGIAPPFPIRDGNRITPMILAQEMYPALERMALGARQRLFLAFRIFDPKTATRSPDALALGLENWGQLLRHTVERGVVVKLLLADFEPTVAHHLHGGSWTTFRRMREIAETLDPDALERFEMIIAQHPGELGWLPRQLLRLPIGLAVRKTIAGLDPQEADRLMDVRPGLWRYHRKVDGQPQFRRGPAPRLWPAIHHHKFAVADDIIAIVGGIDVDERRWDTRSHQLPAPQSWHDISVQVEGPAAGDAAEHFRRLWNAELPRYVEITRHWMSGAERTLTVEPLDSIPDPVIVPAPIAGAAGRAQMLRTASVRSGRILAVRPRKQVRELMQAHRRLIFSARKLLYIEAQFFRSRRAASWVVEAARGNPQLAVIVLLPQAPEEVAFNGERKNPAHQHGEWLQARALGHMRRRLGARLGLYSLGRNAPMTEAERKVASDRGAAFGAGIIYVHSKLLIADDRAALVSSANINGRSFGWDSEFGILWEEPDAVEAFRRKLWSQLLGCRPRDVPGLTEAGAYWADLANANVVIAPEERTGFVLPYRYASVRRFGRPAWFLPDDLV